MVVNGQVVKQFCSCPRWEPVIWELVGGCWHSWTGPGLFLIRMQAGPRQWVEVVGASLQACPTQLPPP